MSTYNNNFHELVSPPTECECKNNFKSLVQGVNTVACSAFIVSNDKTSISQHKFIIWRHHVSQSER